MLPCDVYDGRAYISPHHDFLWFKSSALAMMGHRLPEISGGLRIYICKYYSERAFEISTHVKPSHNISATIIDFRGSRRVSKCTRWFEKGAWALPRLLRNSCHLVLKFGKSRY